MTPAPLGLVDTSVLIAGETGRAFDRDLFPECSAVSVVTFAELNAGVLAAHDSDTRTRRLVTLQGLADVEVLPIDEPVAREWARLRVFLAEHHRRMNVNDLWIAATAAARRIPLLTQDADFEALVGARGLDVIRV